MTGLNIPQRSFFSFTFRCPYRADPPIIDGNLRDWEAAYRVPDLAGVEGQEPFAPVYMAWNEAGLYLAVEVRRKTRYRIEPSSYWQGDCLEVWLDTRDVKDSHRATRFCHHFFFLPGGSGRDGRGPIGRQTTIDKAREQAPPCPEESIAVGLRRLKQSYQMEIHLPAAGLNGFQPGEFDRLGFNYLLRDCERGVQSWTVGRSPPLVHDPSTWGTAELVPPP
ncbi:MAG: hypothetical protein ABIL09_20005 [Gemmatimonadota bacterium]